VTGAASRVWEANPTLNAVQIKDILLRSAIDLGPPGWDALTGSGKLNLEGAIALAQQTSAQPYNPAPYLIPTTWSGAGKVTPTERPADITTDTVDLGVNPTSGTRRGTLNPVNFFDYYRFTVTSQQEITLDFGLGGVTSNTGVILTLKDSAGKSLGKLNSTLVGPQLIRQVLEPGAYSIEITTANFRVDATSEYGIGLGLMATSPPPGNDSGTPKTPISKPNPIPNPTDVPTPSYIVAPPFVEVYEKLGKEKGWLGLPTANSTIEGEGVLKQEFENGYIIWNGSDAVAYDRGKFKISDRDKKGFKTLEQIQRDYQVQDDSEDFFEFLGQKKEMTEKEAVMLRKLWLWEIKEFFDISNNRQFLVFDKGRAFKEAARQFPAGESDGHQDAFRHAFWNILLAKSSSFGKDWAEKFTTAHEGRSGNPAAREAMDLYNNEVGRSIYQKNPEKSEGELSELLKEAINKGELLVIHSDLNLAWSDQVIPGATGIIT
jgi:hypothetical protein